MIEDAPGEQQLRGPKDPANRVEHQKNGMLQLSVYPRASDLAHVPTYTRFHEGAIAELRIVVLPFRRRSLT